MISSGGPHTTGFCKAQEKMSFDAESGYVVHKGVSMLTVQPKDSSPGMGSHWSLCEYTVLGVFCWKRAWTWPSHFLYVVERAKHKKSEAETWGLLQCAVCHIRFPNTVMLTSSHHNPFLCLCHSPSLYFLSLFPSNSLGNTWPSSVNWWMGFKQQNRINICFPKDFPLPSAHTLISTLKSDVCLLMFIDSGIEARSGEGRFKEILILSCPLEKLLSY